MDLSTTNRRALESPGDPERTTDLNLEALLADLASKYPEYLQHFRGANPGPFRIPEDPKPAVFSFAPASPMPEAMEEEDHCRPFLTQGLHPKAIPGPSAQPIKAKEPRSKVITGPSAQVVLVKEISKTTPGPSAPVIIPAERVEEPHSETSPASSEVDDFKVVQTKSQKRKLKASKSHANPTKKVIITAHSTSSRSAPSSQGTPTEESEDAPMEGPRREKIPPLYIREKLSWQRILPILEQQGVSFETARSTAIGIRVDCPTSADHRSLTRILRQENVGFHTYALPDERVLRVVVRGLPRELDTELIKADLLSQKLPVLQVHRMYHPRTKSPYEMVLVTLEPSPEGKKIFDISSVCRLSGLRIEPPNSRGRMGQCHRCQMYGHSARNCYAHPRCVKCLGDHGTSDCPRTQPTEEPPSCVLCRTQGHPANYRGCPKAPREQKRRGKPAGRKPAPTPSAPRFVPAPAPATNAWTKPLFRANVPAPQPQAAASPAQPAPTAAKMPAAPTTTTGSSSAYDRFADNMTYIESVLATIDIEEMDAFVRESRVNPLRAISDHSGLLKAINNLKHLNG